MYGTSGVIHVWYIRCDIEMPPPPASRQASPAIQRRGARGLLMSDGTLGRRWMAGLAWRLAGGGGGISITPDVLFFQGARLHSANTPKSAIEGNYKTKHLILLP